jgi:hypothetical protein
MDLEGGVASFVVRRPADAGEWTLAAESDGLPTLRRVFAGVA